MANQRRYTCEFCGGVTHNSPEPELCGVCGAIGGLGGDPNAVPCDWCLMHKAPDGTMCDECRTETEAWRSKKPSCQVCYEREAAPGSTVCSWCRDAPIGWGGTWVEHKAPMEEPVPAPEDEVEVFKVGV